MSQGQCWGYLGVCLFFPAVLRPTESPVFSPAPADGAVVLCPAAEWGQPPGAAFPPLGAPGLPALPDPAPELLQNLDDPSPDSRQPHRSRSEAQPGYARDGTAPLGDRWRSRPAVGLPGAGGGSPRGRQGGTAGGPHCKGESPAQGTDIGAARLVGALSWAPKGHRFESWPRRI